MKRNLFFVLFLLVLSSISGYLLSKASLVGRIGINLFYKQYKFLKVWWQGALTVFTVLLVLFFIHWLINKKFTKAKLAHIVLLLVAIAGLYFTYLDFRNTATHRWLGERFHLGAYLFWLGWISISIYFIVQPKKPQLPVATPFQNLEV